MKNFERSEALEAEVGQLNHEFSQIVKNHVQARLKKFTFRNNDFFSTSLKIEGYYSIRSKYFFSKYYKMKYFWIIKKVLEIEGRSWKWIQSSKGR